MNRAVSLCIISIILAGCAAAPVSQTGEKWKQRDSSTQYKFFEEPDGFIASVNYGHYQFFPENSAAGGACRKVLLEVVNARAAEIGRAIKPVDESQISMSFRRNGLTGITSCAANVPVQWE